MEFPSTSKICGQCVLGSLPNLLVLDLSGNQLSNLVPLEVAQRGGKIQNTEGNFSCRFAPPGNPGLSLPDTQDYRDADLDGDGLICGLGFSAGLASTVAAPEGWKEERSHGLVGRRWQ